MSMKNSLFKKINLFEKLAVYGDRSVFLNALGQQFTSQQLLMNNESDPNSYPEINGIVDRILSPQPEDKFNVDDLRPLAIQLNTESMKSPLDLNLIRGLVGQIAANTQENGGQLHDDSLNLYNKINTNIKATEVKPSFPKSKSNTNNSPKYYPTSSKSNQNLTTDPNIISANKTIATVEKLLADWKNPLMATNKNSLLAQLEGLSSQLNQFFQFLKHKSESIEAIPSKNPEEQMQDKKDLQDITVTQSKILDLLSQLSTINSSGMMTNVSGPKSK